ncbi:Uncharacterised protein [Vibrio cholerae]|nr:Uncharacterised protein [Vibrio cholerae]
MSIPRCRDAIERAENIRQLLFGYTFAIIIDAHDELLVLNGKGYVDLLLPVVDRVTHHVFQCTHQ